MENRIHEEVLKMNELGIKDMDSISKHLRNVFGSKFMLTRLEADYLTDYINDKLNFEAPIIDFKTIVKYGE